MLRIDDLPALQSESAGRQNGKQLYHNAQIVAQIVAQIIIRTFRVKQKKNSLDDCVDVKYCLKHIKSPISMPNML